MYIFIWNAINGVSTNYHDDGGLGVIADSLEAAREMLNTPFTFTYERKIMGGTETVSVTDRHVPEDCEAFTVEPDESFKLVGQIEPKVMVWPNAGCC